MMNRADEETVRLAVELTLLPGVGSLTQIRLWKSHDLRKLFAMKEQGLAAAGVPQKALTPLRRREFKARAEEICAWAGREGVRILLAGAPGYPGLLGEVADPPTVLYARGAPEALLPPRVAVVGTRRPTLYGQRVAEEFGAALGERGVAVVSGLARGIDAAAHRGCLDKGGVTVAVLGSGIDVIYPREHQRLAAQIAQTGALLSEFPPGTAPAPHNFPLRNRVVSGLSLGTLVVEAGERSGSLITARLAAEQNREVFAVPGNITAPQSLGPNYLIKQGAKLVQCWRDVADELPEDVRRHILLKEEALSHDVPESDAVPPEAARALELLREDEATHFEQLLTRLPAGGDADVARLGALLLELESSGHVRQLPGNLYVRLRK
ncbi:MAG: DNA-processing protein DprA [Acidobacteriota bacterium]|jgi:DNA processing protein|nr:DNA-processing protein DprA [Acidobacteriota bacterium]